MLSGKKPTPLIDLVSMRFGRLKSCCTGFLMLLFSIFLVLKLYNTVNNQLPSPMPEIPVVEEKSNERHVRKHAPPAPGTESKQSADPTENAAVASWHSSHNHHSTEKKIVYISIPHTGSLTFQSTLLGYAYIYSKSLILSAKKNGHFVDTRDLEPDSSWSILPRKETAPQMMVEQAVYRQKFFGKYFPNNTVYIASLRNPKTWFTSYAEYLNKREMGNKFAPKDILYNSSFFSGPADPQMNWVVHNPFLHWLDDDTYHERSVLDHIDLIDKKFQLILLAEYTPESLVLLRRHFHWSMADIFHSIPSLGYIRSASELTPDEDDMLVNAQHNRGDWLLYQHFNRTFWKKISAEKDFYEELDTFVNLNVQVSNFCGNGIDVKKVLHVYTQWEPDITFDGQRCFSLRNRWKEIFSIK